ncbi:nitronate monooxygenase [Antricoccus suffuscus]|uniref:nitronate monooxygenase n=1 Tax=Antricoccus suffuscus TaxID=1629062 RepID=UPI00192DCB8F|nr:nitronate monooxygenase [Antricoccus suffuscus]
MQAPMAGACTPELAAVVSNAGGLGFLAAGYKSCEGMAAEIDRMRALTAEPFAMNLFTPQLDRTDELGPRVARYRDSLAATAQKYGVELGVAAYDRDDFEAKIAYLSAHPVAAVTFTFGPVDVETVTALRAAGSEVGFTVTSAHEAREAVRLGATFLFAQGAEAGGHRGTWNISDVPNTDDAATVTRAVIEATGLPTVAAGGVDGPDAVKALVAAGAFAAGVGTLFVAADESSSPEPHKDALASGDFTQATVTRAFSGRLARALTNDFVREHDAAAPSAYPNLHHMTKTIRGAAGKAGDPQGMALWAGSGHASAIRRPAAQVLADLWPTGAEG